MRSGRPNLNPLRNSENLDFNSCLSRSSEVKTNNWKRKLTEVDMVTAKLGPRVGGWGEVVKDRMSRTSEVKCHN